MENRARDNEAQRSEHAITLCDVSVTQRASRLLSVGKREHVVVLPPEELTQREDID